MSIKPDMFDVFHLSDISQGVIKKKGKRIFRGFGSDATDKTDNIIYILSPGLERMVAFKAFLESFKLNFTKEHELKKEADKNSHTYEEFTADLSYDITLNIPAHSTNEAKNNLAKLEELQRLISPLGGPSERNAYYGASNNYFCVWFKNLISSGNKYSSYPTTTDITFQTLIQNGFMCWIDQVNYEPDMAAGFFDFDDSRDSIASAYLFPKNIKLTLKLNFGVEFSGTMKKNLDSIAVNISNPIYAFSSNGHYAINDSGRFPFGLLAGSQGFTETPGGEIDYSTDTMNEQDHSFFGSGAKSRNSYLFISLPVDIDSGPDSFGADSKRKRWVQFHGFIESFKRDYKITTPLNDKDKSRILGKPMNMDAKTTFESLDFSMKVNVISANISEAKKNTAKIQYLCRIFFKNYDAGSITDNRKSNIGLTKNLIKFYSPSFLEAAGATKYHATDFKGMYENSVDLFFTDLSLDIDIEQGFFEEEGHLYPKAMSIEIKMVDGTGELIKNYALKSGGTYSMLPSSTYLNKEHLFPFNRQTTKITIGGQ